jgi:hypothetical protein
LQTLQVTPPFVHFGEQDDGADLKPIKSKSPCNDSKGLPDTYGPTAAFWTKFVATFQSLFALILIFLTGLTARRRFQIN